MRNKPRKSNENNFMIILNLIVDPAVIIDERGRFLAINNAFEDLTGLSKKKVIGTAFLDASVLTAESKAILLKNFKKRMQGLPVEPYEISFTDKTDKMRYVEVKAKKIDYAGHPADLVMFRDITRRKENARRLKEYSEKMEALVNEKVKEIKESGEKYRELINGMNDTAWVIGLDGNFIDVNDAAVKVLGYSRKELLSMGPPDIDNSLTKEQIKDLIRSMPADQIQVFETAHTTKDGKKIPVEISSSLVTYQGKQAILSIARDITERKIMQDRLAEYSQKLEKIVEKRTEQLKQTQAKLVKSERLATIGELAAMVGHDLRNPLTGIMGAAYYLKAKHGTEVGAKGKEMLEIIENAINYSNKIINDLLEYSRDLKLEFTETTPKAMVQSTLSSLEVPEKIQIIDATKDKPAVKADTEKIRKGFVNIIQNAIDAMPEGGTLTIKSRKVKSKLEIAFKDTGTGMSEEALSKLKRGVPLFTTKSKGMGFGLPICRRLVEAHGGKISVESMAGKGTTVTVTIPVNPEPVDEGEEKWIVSESMLSAIAAAHRAR